MNKRRNRKAEGILFNTVNDVIFSLFGFQENNASGHLSKKVYIEYFSVNRAYIKQDDSNKY